MISGRAHRDFVTSESVASCDHETEPVAMVFIGFPRQLKHESSRIIQKMALFHCFQPAGEEWRKIGAGGLQLEHSMFTFS